MRDHSMQPHRIKYKGEIVTYLPPEVIESIQAIALCHDKEFWQYQDMLHGYLSIDPSYTPLGKHLHLVDYWICMAHDTEPDFTLPAWLVEVLRYFTQRGYLRFQGMLLVCWVKDTWRKMVEKQQEEIPF